MKFQVGGGGSAVLQVWNLFYMFHTSYNKTNGVVLLASGLRPPIITL